MEKNIKVKIVCKTTAPELETILSDNNIEISDSPDIIIAYGGDGTALHAINISNKADKTIPVLAIRTPESLGFISDIDLEQFKSAIPSLANYKTKNITTLEVSINNKTQLAVNDINLSGTIPRSIKFNIYHNSTMLLKKVIGDGVIIATPLGSTAYNLSAGGPILMTNNICLTLNNPHSHKKHSYVLPISDTIILEALTTAEIVCDGRAQDKIDLQPGDKVTISVSKTFTKLVKIPGFEEPENKKRARLINRCNL